MILLPLLFLVVDFQHDVAPILTAKCASCHRPGEVAPFSLLTYQDAASKAKTIAAVIDKGLMPPWKPVHGYGDFQNERRLTKHESELILKWVTSGAKGSPTGIAPPTSSQEWKLGPPDLVIQMPKPFAVAADGADQYQCFVIPIPRGTSQFIRAWEFQPGSRHTVHHALFFLDSSHAGAKRAAAQDGTYSCFGVPGFLPSGSLGGWSPGSAPFTATDETAAGHIRTGEDLVMQIHYHPTGKPEQDQSRIGLYYSTYTTKNPPPRKVVDVALVSKQIDIQPGDAAFKVQDHFTLPIDVNAVGIIPHAHYIAKQIKCWATLPNGKIRWLLRIDDWDFNWQDQYRYAKPILLPTDTRLDMEIIYDNSANNPRNPSNPPQRVLWGPDSTDEMAGVHIQSIPVRMEELPELGQALWGKIMRAVGGSFYRPPEQQ